MVTKQERRNKIKTRIRGKVSGTAERPRMTVFRSNKQIYVQLVDDSEGKTLASASSKGIEEGTKTEVAAKVGQAIAEKALAAGITEVVFDRNGYLFHGRVKSLADAARNGGLNLIRVPVHKGTIPHEQAAKFGGSRVILKPASQGTGVKAGGAMRAVLESVGITDVLCKSKGSSNPHNLVKATFGALDEMRSPMTVAQNRGVSLDVVFNG